MHKAEPSHNEFEIFSKGKPGVEFVVVVSDNYIGEVGYKCSLEVFPTNPLFPDFERMYLGYSIMLRDAKDILPRMFNINQIDMYCLDTVFQSIESRGAFIAKRNGLIKKELRKIKKDIDLEVFWELIGKTREKP